MAKKTTPQTITLEMTLEEAEQVVINLGSQSGILAKKIYADAVGRDKPKYDEKALYNVFDRLDDLVNEEKARISKARFGKNKKIDL